MPQGSSDTTFTLGYRRVDHSLPMQGVAVLVFHAGGVDRGCRYGDVWRHAEYGEDQLYDVVGWADLPEPPVMAAQSTEAPALSFRDFLIACVGGLMQNDAITTGQGVDHLLAEMERLGFRIVKELEHMVDQTTSNDPYEWTKDEPGGLRRACAAAATAGRSVAGWSERPFVHEDGSVEIRCALMLESIPAGANPTTIQ